MEIKVAFSDRTIEYALHRHLPLTEIEKMCELLGRYAVSCFDVSLCADLPYHQAGNSLPMSQMRCLIDTSAEETSQITNFGQIAVRVRQSNQKDMEKSIAAVHVVEGADVYLYLEDAWRMWPDEWEAVFAFAERHGVKGIIYCSNGAENLFELYECLYSIVQNAPCLVEFKASDSCHMATAQTLAALRAGVNRVCASAAGIGGAAPLEEVMMAAGQLWNAAIPSSRTLAEDFGTILSSLGVHTSPRKALIGSNVFAHESGIHVDGIVKNPSLYEVIRPEDVGLTRRLVIGKHSGNASVRIKLLQHGIRISQPDAMVLLGKVKKLAQRQKRALTDEQLLVLYQKYIAEGSMIHAGCKNL